MRPNLDYIQAHQHAAYEMAELENSSLPILRSLENIPILLSEIKRLEAVILNFVDNNENNNFKVLALEKENAKLRRALQNCLLIESGMDADMRIQIWREGQSALEESNDE